jgi:hypothetical protein
MVIDLNPEDVALVAGLDEDKENTVTMSPIEDEAENSESVENDEWCSVCSDGGELICCDNCPKAFHLQCHVPAFTEVPKTSWKCSLCRDPLKMEPPPGYSRPPMTSRDKLICERLLLELMVHEKGKQFQKPVDIAKHPSYSATVKRPMDLSTIIKRLSGNRVYSNASKVVQDVNLIFYNCYLYNKDTSTIYKNAQELEKKLREIVNRFFPNDINLKNMVNISQVQLLAEDVETLAKKQRTS